MQVSNHKEFLLFLQSSIRTKYNREIALEDLHVICPMGNNALVIDVNNPLEIFVLTLV